MTTFTITTTITCGEKTCAIEPGVFCEHLGAIHFGQKPWCMWFDEKLYDPEGWVLRCDKCLDAEKESK